MVSTWQLLGMVIKGAWLAPDVPFFTLGYMNWPHDVEDSCLGAKVMFTKQRYYILVNEQVSLKS